MKQIFGMEKNGKVKDYVKLSCTDYMKTGLFILVNKKF